MKEKIARDPVSHSLYLLFCAVTPLTHPCPTLQPPKDAKRESGSASTSAAQFAYVDPDLNWEDIAWIQKIALGKPIVIKGISCVEVCVSACSGRGSDDAHDLDIRRTPSWRWSTVAKESYFQITG